MRSLGDTRPGGLFVEVAAYHAFDNIPHDDADNALTSTAAYYTRALTEMAPLIRGHADGSAPLSNPALPDQDISVRATQRRDGRHRRGVGRGGQGRR